MREIVTAQDGTPVAETERRPYRLSGPRRLAATLGSAAVILLLAGVTWLAVQRSRESTGWVRHTYRVTVVLGRTVSDLVDAETGQRGYLLTGDERYLAPYRQGAARFAHDLEALRGLTRDNPRQQARIGQMQRLGTAKLNELSRTIRLYQQGQADASRAVVRSGPGERLM
ncbi:CHASE3 domain-containing protein, partial [Longimicrobium sp.]|uniref:CHASE3 domain-containing protein n=1 Tax=Longimicrobium sp. TaxID=2029185 RepID=UPI002ED96D77